MFVKRLISGIVLVILMLLLIITGNDVLLIAMLALSLIGAYELLKVLELEKHLAGGLTYLCIIAYYLNLRFSFSADNMVIFMTFMVLLLGVFVMKYPDFTFDKCAGCVFTVMYVGIMLSYIYKLRMMDGGAYTVWLVFLSCWGCDTLAYCTGMLFGKHKMSPVLSPKKSVEGAVGGVIGAGILTLIYLLVVRNQMGLDNGQIAVLIVIVMLGSLISMLGDLSASAIKRFYNIKDYGNLIPGHGGVLDRFDSIIICAPIVYYLAYYLA